MYEVALAGTSQSLQQRSTFCPNGWAQCTTPGVGLQFEKGYIIFRYIARDMYICRWPKSLVYLCNLEMLWNTRTTSPITKPSPRLCCRIVKNSGKKMTGSFTFSRGLLK